MKLRERQRNRQKEEGGGEKRRKTPTNHLIYTPLPSYLHTPQLSTVLTWANVPSKMAAWGWWWEVQSRLFPQWRQDVPWGDAGREERREQNIY